MNINNNLITMLIAMLIINHASDKLATILLIAIIPWY